MYRYSHSQALNWIRMSQFATRDHLFDRALNCGNVYPIPIDAVIFVFNNEIISREMRQKLSPLFIVAVDCFFFAVKKPQREKNNKIIAIIKLNNNAVCFYNPPVVLLFCFWGFFLFCFNFYLKPCANCGLKIST